MKYLLDTCVISEAVKKNPSEKVVNWINANDEEGMYLSVLTIGEIQKGLSRLPDSRRKASIQRWLDMELRIRFLGRILPVSEDVAISWGDLQAETENKGTPVPTIDGLIGATALTYNLTVVTRNVADLKNTRVKVLNPWD